MRRSILKMLPAEKLGERFHEFLGRPSKEMYAMCGLMLLAEFRDLTIDQAASAWSSDASVQYALNLPRDRQSLCARTLDTYRRLLREDEAAQDMGTLPKEELADTAHGSEANAALCASVAVTLAAPAPGRAATAKRKKQTAPEGTSSPVTWTEVRRAEQESGEWKKRYALRSGIEGVNEALDRTVGMKALRVRGMFAFHVRFHTGGSNPLRTAPMLGAHKTRHSNPYQPPCLNALPKLQPQSRDRRSLPLIGLPAL